MTTNIDDLSQGDETSLCLFPQTTSQASADVQTALENGEFYGPGGSREEFISWMEEQEPDWEKWKQANMTIDDFYDAYMYWEEAYTMYCTHHLLPTTYLEAYRDRNKKIQEEKAAKAAKEKLQPFLMFHADLRKACRRQRAKEELPDGRNMRDAVDQFFTQKCRITLDAQGEPCVELLEISKRCKLLNLAGLPKNYTVTQKNNRLLGDMENGEQVCLYKNCLASPEIQARLRDAQEVGGYSTDPNKTDEVLAYLAKEFGVSYTKKTGKGYNTQVVKIYMAVLGRLGWEWKNRHRDGTDGGLNGADFTQNGKIMNEIQVAFMHDDFQLLSRYYDGGDFNSASLGLVAG